MSWGFEDQDETIARLERENEHLQKLSRVLAKNVVMLCLDYGEPGEEAVDAAIADAEEEVSGLL